MLWLRGWAPTSSLAAARQGEPWRDCWPARSGAANVNPEHWNKPVSLCFRRAPPKPPVWPNTDMDAPAPGPCESVCTPVFVIASPSLILPICRQPVSPCNGPSATVHHLSPSYAAQPGIIHHTKPSSSIASPPAPSPFNVYLPIAIASFSQPHPLP